MRVVKIHVLGPLEEQRAVLVAEAVVHGVEAAEDGPGSRRGAGRLLLDERGAQVVELAGLVVAEDVEVLGASEFGFWYTSPHIFL